MCIVADEAMRNKRGRRQDDMLMTCDMQEQQFGGRL